MSRSRRESIAAFVDKAFAALDNVDYYQVLGVNSSASAADIRNAYYSLATNLHPDVHGLDVEPAYRDRLTTVYSRVVEAYKVLSDETRRTRYDSTLAGGSLRARAGATPAPKRQEDSITNAAARRFFDLGMAALRDKNPTSAITNFRFALSMEPENDLIKSKLAEAESQSKS